MGGSRLDPLAREARLEDRFDEFIAFLSYLTRRVSVGIQEASARVELEGQTAMASDAACRTGSVCHNSGIPSSLSHRSEIQDRMGSEGRQELGTEIFKEAMAALSPVAASRDLGSIVREACAGAKAFGTAPTARVQGLVKAWTKAVEPMGLGSAKKHGLFLRLAETRFDAGPGGFFIDSGVWTAPMTEKSSGTRGAAIGGEPSTLAADDGGEPRWEYDDFSTPLSNTCHSNMLNRILFESSKKSLATVALRLGIFGTGRGEASREGMS